MTGRIFVAGHRGMVGSALVRALATRGDDAPVAWLTRDERYGEKLATPDVSVADLIGDAEDGEELDQRRDGDGVFSDLHLHLEELYWCLPESECLRC